MSALTKKEQRHVRTVLRFLRVQVGTWAPIAKALRFDGETIGKVVTGRREVSTNMAFRVARFVGVGVEELLAGEYLSPRTCRHCGHPPEDFEDEETVVEEVPRWERLKLVK